MEPLGVSDVPAGTPVLLALGQPPEELAPLDEELDDDPEDDPDEELDDEPGD
jgi:hypothetical protein